MNGQINAGDLRPQKYFLVVAALLGLMFAFISPDESYTGGWLAHGLHWQIQTVIPMCLAIAFHTQLAKLTYFKKFYPFVQLSLSGLIASVFVTPVALSSDMTIANETLSRSLVTELIDEFWAVCPPIVVFWVAINLPFFYGWQFSRLAKSESNCGSELFSVELDKSSSVSRTPAFYRLLPDSIRGELVYLKSELHYLQVVTTEGNALILYSLKAAIAEIDQADGFQPHRSFWVHRDAVDSIKKNGREGVIVVKNGDRIPISRSNLKDLMSEYENRVER